jgi:mannosyltransferase
VSSVAARPLDRLRVRVRPSSAAVTVGGLAALVAVSLWLRTQSLDAAFWIDEALSVGIASYDLLDIPGRLREDGSPPLYYLLLHGWMQGFGTSETATHVLSLVFALLFVPTAWWAGRTLFDERTAWVAALLGALNPFLTFYAQETRMYSLSALLSLVVATTFVQAFARRERRYLPGFVAAMATMLYTHNWAIFLGAGTFGALVLLWRWAGAGEERRALVRDGLLAYGTVALLYLPWLPTLLFQAAHTGAPWATRPDVDRLLSALGLMLGSAAPAIAILLVGGNGLAQLVQREQARRTASLIALTLLAVLAAFLASQLSPALANRYFSAFVGPLLLLAAIGLAHAGRLGLVALVLVVAFWFDPRTGPLESKSNARAVSASIATYVTAGDLVVSTHPEQLPLMAYYLPQGVRYADSLGPVDDPRMFDWTDATDRLKAARPTPTVNRLLATMQPGQELVLIQPLIRTASWEAPWTSLVRRRSVQWERVLDKDPRMRREAVVPVFGFDRLPKGVRAVVYRMR